MVTVHSFFNVLTSPTKMYVYFEVILWGPSKNSEKFEELFLEFLGWGNVEIYIHLRWTEYNHKL